MCLKTATLLACSLVFIPVATHADSTLLTLDQAFDRVLTEHPELAVFQLREEILDADSKTAAQPPPFEVGISVDDALGTNDHTGFQRADLTLTLSSVLERGRKRDARVTVTESTRLALQPEQEARRLDLLAETARRYLVVVQADTRCSIAESAITAARAVVAATTERLNAGAGREADRWSAEATVMRTELLLSECRLARTAAIRQLSVMWGGVEPTDYVVSALPERLPTLVPAATMLTRLAETPELRRFASTQRLREARLQLARAAETADITWQVGLRRLEAADSFGLVGSLSMPIGTRARAQSSIEAARAELAMTTLEAEAGSRTLQSTLLRAHDLYVAAKSASDSWRDDVAPMLDKAARATEAAYRNGASDALQWRALQNEIVQAQLEGLEARIRGHAALIEMERLIGATPLAEMSTRGHNDATVQISAGEQP